MSRRTMAVVAFTLIAAAAFARLGVWQLSRLAERQTRNAYVAARLDSAAVPYWTLPRDSARTHFRRVTVAGTPDFAHEFYYINRSHQGSPGVYVLTPVRVAGQDTAVVVNRGWVYAPDGAVIEAGRWHSPDSLFEGYVEEFQPADSNPPRTPGQLRRVNARQIAAGAPYPIAATYVVAIGNDSAVYGTPLRILPPVLDEGPHRSYAIQWFVFAIMAVAAGVFVALKEREGGRGKREEGER
jgi:surfeit locus 1 family protein